MAKYQKIVFSKWTYGLFGPGRFGGMKVFFVFSH